MSSSGGASTPKEVIPFVSPFAELNAGLWLLFAGATFFLGLRLWCKVTRRQALWSDDHILLFSWVSQPSKFQRPSLTDSIPGFVPNKQRHHRARVRNGVHPRGQQPEVG